MKAALSSWWGAMAPREKNLVTLAGAFIAFYIVFAVAIQPAWRTVRAAPAQLDALENQLQTMQKLAADTAELKAAVPVSAAQSAAALKAASDRLGAKAKLALQGERAVLTINGASTEELRNWLTEARSGARARPVEASLSKADTGFSGTVVVAIGGTP